MPWPRPGRCVVSLDAFFPFLPALLPKIDLDTIETSNLNRQFLFRQQHVGQSKAAVAAEAVRKLAPGVNVFAHQVVAGGSIVAGARGGLGSSGGGEGGEPLLSGRHRPCSPRKAQSRAMCMDRMPDPRTSSPCPAGQCERAEV